MALGATARILFVGGAPASERWLRGAIGGAAPGQREIVCVEDVDRSVSLAAQGGWDLVMFDLDRMPTQSGLAAVRRLRDAHPSIPIVALAETCGEDVILAALRAGAEDCVERRDGEALKSIRIAVERSRLRMAHDARGEDATSEREIGGLGDLCGTSPLPVTERNFGIQALSNCAPEQFQRFIERYAALLDIATAHHGSQLEETSTSELNALADRMGMLGAGPRDIIDLHKAAIASGLDGKSGPRAKAFVEEGRLLLLQLMGHLVSFYRNLSWGHGVAIGSRFSRDANRAAPERRNDAR